MLKSPVGKGKGLRQNQGDGSERTATGSNGKEAAAGAGLARALGTHTTGLSCPSPCGNLVAIMMLGYSVWLKLLVLLHSLLGTIF